MFVSVVFMASEALRRRTRSSFTGLCADRCALERNTTLLPLALLAPPLSAHLIPPQLPRSHRLPSPETHAAPHKPRAISFARASRRGREAGRAHSCPCDIHRDFHCAVCCSQEFLKDVLWCTHCGTSRLTSFAHMLSLTPQLIPSHVPCDAYHGSPSLAPPPRVPRSYARTAVDFGKPLCQFLSLDHNCFFPDKHPPTRSLYLVCAHWPPYYGTQADER